MNIFKTLTFSGVILFFSCLTYAKTIIYSEPFDEHTTGWNRILVLKNGNTAFVHLGSEGIEVRIYGPDHKRLVFMKNANNGFNIGLATTYIEGVFEINGQIEIFLSQLKSKNVSELKRVTIDPVTAKVVKTETLLTGNGFDVKKDDGSDAYFVVSRQDGSPLNINTYFDSISTKQYTVSIPEMQAVNIIGAGESDKSCYIIISPVAKKHKPMEVYIASLIDGANDFEVHKIDAELPAEYNMRYVTFDGKTKKFNIVNVTEVDKKSEYSTFGGHNLISYLATQLTTIDVTTNVASTKMILGKKVDDYAKNKLGVEEGYSGSFNFLESIDEGTVLGFEERYTINNGRSTTYGYGNVGILLLDKEGNELKGYSVQKKQAKPSSVFSGLSMGSPYFGYAYFHSKGGDYVVVNDLPENLERSSNKDLKTLLTVSDANAVLYSFNKDNTDRSLLFDVSANKRITRFANISSSRFDANTNTYITLMIESNNGLKKEHLAWVTLD